MNLHKVNLSLAVVVLIFGNLLIACPASTGTTTTNSALEASFDIHDNFAEYFKFTNANQVQNTDATWHLAIQNNVGTGAEIRLGDVTSVLAGETSGGSSWADFDSTDDLSAISFKFDEPDGTSNAIGSYLNKIYILCTGSALNFGTLKAECPTNVTNYYKVKITAVSATDASVVVSPLTTPVEPAPVNVPLDVNDDMTYLDLSTPSTPVSIAPPKADWDIVLLTAYWGYSGTIPYILAGVYINKFGGVRAYKLEATFDDVTTVEPAKFTTKLDVIGADWKVFSGTWMLEDWTYIIETVDGRYVKMAFTDYTELIGGMFVSKYPKLKYSIAQLGSLTF